MRKRLFKVAFFVASPFFKTYWFVVRPETTGVKCVLTSGNKVLLIRNSYGLKLWTLPGGGVKRNETLEDAVIREVEEEVGVEIKSPRKRGNVFWDGEYKRNTIWVFVAEVPSLEFNPDNIEIEEARWFDMNNLPKVKSHLLTQFLEIAKK